MYSRRIRIDGMLKVLSPFHPGSGDFAEDEALDVKKEDVKPRIALLARDDKKMPYLAGTAIKGILRRRAGRDRDIESLFGTIKNSQGEDTGSMGRLIVYGSSMAQPGDTGALPRPGKRDDGIYVAARTKVDGATGAADEGKLFYQEMLAPGATFPLRLLYLPPDGCPDLPPLLARLLKALQGGLAFGKGQADGQGRLKLQDGVTATRVTLAPDGCLKEEPLAGFAETLAQAEPWPEERSWSLELKCEGPFMVKDWSYATPPQTGEDRDRIQVKAQRQAEKVPELPGTSLMGALRARAEWLAATGVLEDEVVVRLFGTQDAAAVLVLDSLKARPNGKPEKLTSVAIDRFSGAPIDNKLFTSEVFVDPIFDARLSLAPGRAKDGDAEAVETLLADLREDCLMLGHGSTKGFGWFSVDIDPVGGSSCQEN